MEKKYNMLSAVMAAKTDPSLEKQKLTSVCEVVAVGISSQDAFGNKLQYALLRLPHNCGLDPTHSPLLALDPASREISCRY